MKPSLFIPVSNLSHKEGKESSHGAPLGEDEVKKTKENLKIEKDLKTLSLKKIKENRFIFFVLKKRCYL